MSIPCIAYAAKSTADVRGSIPDQLADCRVMAEREGWERVAEYSDEAFSAYHGDRGPGLAQAREHAARLAVQHGRCVLVAQHSDRFARGDGIQAQHLAELWFASRRAGIELHSVQDDSTFTNPLLAVALGERNAEDSRRKALAVRAGMARRRAKGLVNGRAPIGYRNVAGKLIVHTGEVAIVRRVYREFLAGRSQQQIARSLEAEGIRTKRGGHWHKGTISIVLTRRYAVGDILAPDGKSWTRGSHEPIIDRDTWEQAARLREATSRTGRGRRTSSPLIFRKGFLQCGRCGSSMVPRSDAGRYYCMRNKREGAGACPMPAVDAGLIDRAVLADFEANWLDVEGTRARIAESFAGWSGEAAAHLADAEREVQRAQDRYARVRRDYQDGRLDADDWHEQRSELREELAGAQAHLESMRQRAQQVAAEIARSDVEAEMLRALAALRAAESVDHVRAVLQTVFERFVLDLNPNAAKTLALWPEATGRFRVLREHGGLTITPHLRPEIVERMPGGGYRIDQVALPRQHNEYAGLITCSVFEVLFGPIPVEIGGA